MRKCSNLFVFLFLIITICFFNQSFCLKKLFSHARQNMRYVGEIYIDYKLLAKNPQYLYVNIFQACIHRENHPLYNIDLYCYDHKKEAYIHLGDTIFAMKKSYPREIALGNYKYNYMYIKDGRDKLFLIPPPEKEADDL